MSRIGKQPIEIPPGVTVSQSDHKLAVAGPRGNLELALPSRLKVSQTDQRLIVEPTNKTEINDQSLQGTYQRLISNMVVGVTEGFVKVLEFTGVGWRVEVKDKSLIMNVGYSQPQVYKIPAGINIQVEKNVITVSGLDKQLVGQAAAEIRQIRKPEPYKGKGIKYQTEIIRRKAGKQAKTVTT